MKELEQIINKVTRLENMVSERDKAIEALRGKIREWEKKYNEREVIPAAFCIAKEGLSTIEVVELLSKALNGFYRADLITGVDIEEYDGEAIGETVDIRFNIALRVQEVSY